MNYFETDYGSVKVGPQFKQYIANLAPDLAKSKRTKVYKLARARLDRVERCVCVLVEVRWSQGLDLLETTP